MGIDATRCNECGLCGEVCPGASVDMPALTRAFVEDPASTHTVDYVGSYRRLVVGWAADEGVRFAGSSGGATTALLQGGLVEGLVDGAVVTGLRPGFPLETVSTIARDPAAVRLGMGSKYNISMPNRELETMLQVPGRYAIVALPCQVHGLRKAQLSLPSLRERIVLIVGLFCSMANVPRATVIALHRAGMQPGDAVHVSYRGNGWPGGLEARDHRGQVRSVSYPDYCDRWFLAALRPRCLICPDGTSELADISIGDAWLERYVSPPTAGASFIIARTRRGAEFMDRLTPRWVVRDDATADELLLAQAESRQICRPGMRGRYRLRRLLRRPVPAFGSIDLQARKGELRSAAAAAIRETVLRRLGRLRYTAGAVEPPLVLPAGSDPGGERA